MLAYYAETTGYHIRELSGAGRELERFGHGDSLKNFNLRFRGGGITLDEDGSIYLAIPASPFIRKITDRNAPPEIFGNRPTYYRAIEKDMKLHQGDYEAIVTEATAILDSHSVTRNLFRLDNDKFLVQYWNAYNRGHNPREEFGFDIMDGKGRPLLKSEVTMNAPIQHAEHGRAYVVLAADESTSTTLSNPRIEVFDFRY